jgi:hypothetical protein
MPRPVSTVNDMVTHYSIQSLSMSHIEFVIYSCVLQRLTIGLNFNRVSTNYIGKFVKAVLQRSEFKEVWLVSCFCIGCLFRCKGNRVNVVVGIPPFIYPTKSLGQYTCKPVFASIAGDNKVRAIIFQAFDNQSTT